MRGVTRRKDEENLFLSPFFWFIPETVQCDCRPCSRQAFCIPPRMHHLRGRLEPSYLYNGPLQRAPVVTTPG